MLPTGLTTMMCLVLVPLVECTRTVPESQCTSSISVLQLDTKRASTHSSKPRVALMTYVKVNSSAGYHDAFGVLGFSARKAFERSRYSLDLLAISNSEMSKDEHDIMTRYGWKVVVLPFPVPREEVRNKVFVKTEYTKGCGMEGIHAGTFQCMEEENMKLWAVSMVDYERVIFADADVMFLHNVDDVLDMSSHSLAATFDHELDFHEVDGGFGKVNQIPVVNSGWWVVTPSLEDFKAILEIAKEGDFRSGTGWRGSRVGWGFCGAGTQGLLAYYYHLSSLNAGERLLKLPDLPGRMTPTLSFARMKPLDRSVYNVIDTPDLIAAIGDGSASIDRVKVVHFTGECLKPWGCSKLSASGKPNTEFCKNMLDRWWATRASFAAERGLQAEDDRCVEGGSYSPLVK